MSRIGWLRLAVIAIAVGALELACRTGLIDHRVVIPPSEMADALVRLVISGQANEQIARSFGIIIAAIVIAVIAGFILGVVIHALPRLRQALEPFFATYYAVPIFIFYPVMIPIFGLSVVPILLMGVLTAIVAMIIATLNGLDRVPRVLSKVARVHRMGRVATALRLKLPAAAPHLFTGVKLAVSYAFIGVIASEFILAPAGLGRVISDAYSDFNNRRMYALMLLLVVVATVANTVLHMFDQRWAERRGVAKSRHNAMTATRRTFDTLIIFAVMLLAWQGLHQWVGNTALPAPLPTLAYLAKFVPSERFAENAWATLVTFFWALLLSYGLGLSIGLWMGVHRLSAAVGEPILISLYTLPKVTLYPVVLLIFGLTLPGRVTFGAMHGVLPVALLTMAAIRNIPPVYLKSARTLHLSRWQTVLNVLFPATLPEIVSGLRIGFTLTLLGVLLAEMFASKAGLGSLIINAMQLLQNEEMVTVAIVLFAFAAVANALLLWIEHSLHRRV